ncbi:Yip1 family protein [Sphingobium boeckii]|uniref:Yip1 domain-containing protein n=1 Tax=Sphingobium boeckii TaxID=1082345 RepID=A0A7W9AKW6_9SPHN|nr:Yip1 family protein [Sphingobium boeckii]MBB5687563.1 hypothetical protein [Sphingobium boeckii]
MDNLNVKPQAAIITRTKNILLQPKAEWAVIDSESATIGGIYRNHVMILAAIPAVCGLIGGLLIGHSAFGISVRPSVTGAVTGAAISYALTLAGVYLLALVIDWLAPSFNATPDRVQAFKVAAYSGTASWVAGIFLLIPALGFLSLLGLYGLYLLYLGLPRLMKAPQDQAMGYTVVSMIVALVMFLIVGALSAPLIGLASRAAPADQISGELAIPGVGSVDLGKLEAASKQIEAAAAKAQNGQATAAIEPGQLQALLPVALPGMARSEVSSASAGAGGIGGSQAEARYTTGDQSIRLEITDMAAVGALAALGGALNVESTKQTETGYEKMGKVDGRMTTESWDGPSKRGEYSVVVADRFMLSAHGENVEMAALKGAVAAMGIGQFEALAK